MDAPEVIIRKRNGRFASAGCWSSKSLHRDIAAGGISDFRESTVSRPERSIATTATA